MSKQCQVLHRMILTVFCSLMLLQAQAQPQQGSSTPTHASGKGSPAQPPNAAQAVGEFQVLNPPQTFVPHGQPVGSTPIAIQSVKSAFANLLTAPANGFRSMNDAINEAARALVVYAYAPAQASAQELGTTLNPNLVAGLSTTATPTLTITQAQTALAESISRIPQDLLKASGEANLEALKWLAEDLKALPDLAGKVADVVQGGLDAAEGYQDGNKLKIVRGLVGIGSAGIEGSSQVGLLAALVKTALKASMHSQSDPQEVALRAELTAQGLPEDQINARVEGDIDARVEAVEDRATEYALRTLAGSSTLQFASTADAIDAVKSAAKEAVNSITGGSLEAADAMDRFVASGQAEEIMNAAVNAGVKTATGGVIAGADGTGAFVASGQVEQVIKTAANAGVNTATGDAIVDADGAAQTSTGPGLPDRLIQPDSLKLSDLPDQATRLYTGGPGQPLPGSLGQLPSTDAAAQLMLSLTQLAASLNQKAGQPISRGNSTRYSSSGLLPFTTSGSGSLTPYLKAIDACAAAQTAAIQVCNAMPTPKSILDLDQDICFNYANNGFEHCINKVYYSASQPAQIVPSPQPSAIKPGQPSSAQKTQPITHAPSTKAANFSKGSQAQVAARQSASPKSPSQADTNSIQSTAELSKSGLKKPAHSNNEQLRYAAQPVQQHPPSVSTFEPAPVPIVKPVHTPTYVTARPHIQSMPMVKMEPPMPMGRPMPMKREPISIVTSAPVRTVKPVHTPPYVTARPHIQPVPMVMERPTPMPRMEPMHAYLPTPMPRMEPMHAYLPTPMPRMEPMPIVKMEAVPLPILKSSVPVPTYSAPAYTAAPVYTAPGLMPMHVAPTPTPTHPPAHHK